MASPRSSQGPSISEKAPIPEPYNRSSRAVCKQLRHIHKACGQWPWDFLPGRIPESLDKHTLAPLVTAVEFACDDEHHVTLSELTEWLMVQKGDWVLTSTQSSNALEWAITNNQTLEEAIAASARRLEEARNNLREYEDHLQTEREDLKVIDALRSEASDSHEAAIQEWRDAVLQADTKQNELQQFQNLAQSFSRDTQAALEQHSQSLRQLSDQAIEVEKDAEDELRARRREFCILEDKKDTKEGIIKKISARIRRYQDDIDAEEVKHQRLLAEHYLELLSNEIIQGISIADISYAKILEIKLERDQRIWYERRQMD
ncbi:hypothetical protein FPRO06_12876 [Fusarium proliferatum]|nr:hypothetical protein FPRO06_12876 [Fusarium proliferatum]